MLFFFLFPIFKFKLFLLTIFFCILFCLKAIIDTIYLWILLNSLVLLEFVQLIPFFIYIWNLIFLMIQFCILNGTIFYTHCMNDDSSFNLLPQLWSMCFGSSNQLDDELMENQAYFKSIDRKLTASNNPSDFQMIQRQQPFEDQELLLRYDTCQRGVRKDLILMNADFFVKENNHLIDILSTMSSETRLHSLCWHNDLLAKLIASHNRMVESTSLLSIWGIDPILFYEDMARSYFTINKEILFLQQRYLMNHILPYFEVPMLLSHEYKPWITLIDYKVNHTHTITHHIFSYLNVHNKEMVGDESDVCFFPASSVYQDPAYPYLPEFDNDVMYPDSRVHAVIRHFGLKPFMNLNEINNLFQYLPDHYKWTDDYQCFVNHKCSALLHPTQQLNGLIEFNDREAWADWDYDGCWKQHCNRPVKPIGEGESGPYKKDLFSVSKETRTVLYGGHLNAGLTSIQIFPYYFHPDFPNRSTDPEFQPRAVLDMNKVYRKKKLYPSPIYESFSYDQDFFSDKSLHRSEFEKSFAINSFQKIQNTNPFVTDINVWNEYFSI